MESLHTSYKIDITAPYLYKVRKQLDKWSYFTQVIHLANRRGRNLTQVSLTQEPAFI